MWQSSQRHVPPAGFFSFPLSIIIPSSHLHPLHPLPSFLPSFLLFPSAALLACSPCAHPPRSLAQPSTIPSVCCCLFVDLPISKSTRAVGCFLFLFFLFITLLHCPPRPPLSPSLQHKSNCTRLTNNNPYKENSVSMHLRLGLPCTPQT